jgi:uncharacterized protein YeaO (DUF488 family)
MTASTMKVELKRVYEAPEPSDGLRVLVERLWPRGLALHQQVTLVVAAHDLDHSTAPVIQDLLMS